MHEAEAASSSVHERDVAANDNRQARPRIATEDIGEDDVGRVKASFWDAFTAARPRLGRLSGLRDFAVNLVRLFEMLVEPGFVIPWKTTAAVVFALAYFISSIDVIPDTIPILGFLDDAFVVAEVVAMVAVDLARFEEVRRQRRGKQAGSVAAEAELQQAA